MYTATLLIIILSVPAVLIMMGGSAAYVGYLLALILLLMGIFLINTARSWAKSLSPVTDISRYQEIRGYLSMFWSGYTPTAMEHFPPDIPDEAQDILFYYRPGFLRGGTMIQLQMKLLPASVTTIKDLFLGKAKLKYIPGSQNNSLKDEQMPQGFTISHTYNFYIDETIEHDFPENYGILVLEDTRCAPTYQWKYPFSAGVAIDLSTSEIIYWAQQ
jgi:hypothetical protein